MHTMFEYFWLDWKRGFFTVTALVATAGLINAWLAPRDPVTTIQAIVSVAVALIIGTAAGSLMKNRWSLLVTPGVFVIMFELARLGVSGPTVDEIHLSSTYTRSCKI